MLITQTVSDDPAAGADVRARPRWTTSSTVPFSTSAPASRAFRPAGISGWRSWPPSCSPSVSCGRSTRRRISFVLVAPGVVFPDYTIEIDEQHVASLGLESADDALVMAIVRLGAPPTANLLGPLVMNRRTRAAAQVVQYQSSYRAAEPLSVRNLIVARTVTTALSEGGRQFGHGVGGRRGRLHVGLLDLQVDLFAVDLDLSGGVDPDADLVAGHDEDGHLDVVADHDAFTDATTEN